jgi:hypothetical protein
MVAAFQMSACRTAYRDLKPTAGRLILRITGKRPMLADFDTRRPLGALSSDQVKLCAQRDLREIARLALGGAIRYNGC